MKKIFTRLMLWAVAAAALVSCENNLNDENPAVEFLQEVILTAEKPAEVRTELIEGVPYWSKGDAVGVYLEDNTKHYEFKNTTSEASLTATFKGQTAVANTLFVYYPYTSNGVADKGAKVDIPANQEPTATSFDGKADIMLAKPVQLDAQGNQISDLEFARLGAIVKVVLKDKTGNLAGQHVSALTMTAANNLVGRVYVDVVNQELGELYYGGSKSVNAIYTEATQYEVDGTNATYLIVYPQTLAAESKLTIEASTEGYAISKEITLPSDIALESGKVTTLNVSLAADNVVKEETGLDLPFEDDFARIAIDASEGAISSLGDNYSSIEKIYKSKVTAGAVKFGTSSAAGHITTVPLNLSQPFTVVVGALGYKTGETVMKVTVGEVSQTINLTTSEAYYGVEFEAATKKSAVTIETAQDGKRFYLTDLQVVAGHDVVLPTLPPVLTVSKSEISVSHEAATETFTYSVANPVDGVSATVTDNADWFTAADNNGTVTVTVDENTAEEAREGVITVTYGTLTKTVTVKQNAKPAEGGETGGTVVDVLNRALTGATSTSYIDWSGKTSNSTAVYKGNSAGGNSSIQLRSSNSNSGIVTTTSGGKVRKIVVTWNSGTTASRTLDIYGKTSAYSSATDLYSTATATKGTKLGSIVKGTSTELVITGNYEYIGLRSNSGAMYIDEIQITWETGESGGSTPEPATPVLSINPTTLSFEAAGGNKTVACTIENEVSGQNVTATESVDWLSTSVSGKTVTVTATANTATTTRTATVTIAYTGAESKTVTVSQAAAEQGGGDEGGTATPKTVTFTFKNYTKEGTTATEGDVTFTGSKGTASTSTRFWTDGLRTYAGSAMKFEVPAGMVITKIDFTGGTVSDWTGSKQVVEFTGLPKTTITSATVTYQ